MGSKKKKIDNNKTKNKLNSNSNKDGASVSGSSNGNKNANIISDPRFSSMHTDPRFREDAPKHKTKVAIDSRFDRMFSDKSFKPSSAPVDKRGRLHKAPITHHSSLRHYFKIDDNKGEGDESENEEEEEKLAKGIRVRTLESSESESSESESAESECSEPEVSDTDTDTDEGADVDDYDAEEPEVKEEVPQIEKETNRLAVVNMDWRYVKADDLYVLLSSFAPSNGMIKSVAVYPSEFGIQRMKEEEVRGPVGLFDDEKENGSEDISDDDIDNEKLREYEKSRMRYYFAVVECDSSTTADYIYKECDGLEFIQSSNALDLRFIPDDMEFKHPPRDVATEAPANYECKDFYSRALQHSKVNLSWDDDEPIRAKTLKRKFNDEQLAQLELKEFLTSDESDDEEEENNKAEVPLDKKAKKREKYRALLNAGDDSEQDSEDDGIQDMEVTFNTGLEDISKHIMEKKDKKSETVWEAYLRKRREKKKAKKNKSKYSSDDDSSDETDQETAEEADDFFVEEPAVKKKAHSKNGEEDNHQDMDGVEATKEELELLLADDNGTDAGLKGYNLKFKKGKGKKKNNAIDESKIPSSAYDDPRFAALLSPNYIIDPTDPQFKRSAAYARQIAQKQKGDSELLVESEQVNHRRGMQLSSNDSGVIYKGEEVGSYGLKARKDKYELSSLVKSIKMKSKQVQLTSEGKIRKDRKLQKQR